MLSDRDKDAVFALIVRQFEITAALNMAQKEMERARVRLAIAQTAATNLKGAFSIFGFDVSKDKVWETIRDAIGADRYSAAIKIGNGDTEDEEDYIPTEDEPEKPIPSNIRDLVVERLKLAGATGTKVAPIREYIAGQGIEMHAKTVGMTLYRLAKVDGLARVDGRVWFYVTPKEETPESHPGKPELF